MLNEVIRLTKGDFRGLQTKIMHFTIDIQEGMAIKEKNDPDSEKFRLVKSSIDDELYGVGGSKIIKISEINQDDYICDDISCFKNEYTYFEVRFRDKIKLFEDEDLISFLSTKTDFDDYEEFEIKKVAMTLEEFSIKTKNYLSSYISYRDKVKNKYEELKGINKCQ